eukprot:10613907-Alexandrium_andersonii.AAC.1
MFPRARGDQDNASERLASHERAGLNTRLLRNAVVCAVRRHSAPFGAFSLRLKAPGVDSHCGME